VAAAPTDATGGRLGYRSGLDGLRAIAVLAVLAFHAGFDWGRGGWLGVSTFFTLSGFLITTVLLSDHDDHGGVRFAHFWSRRARRLLAAAWLAIAGAIVFGATVADGGQLARLRGDVVAALAYVANWRFMASDASYADLFRSPSPLLHFWSLAIEEQFYLVFPFLLAGVFTVARNRRTLTGVLVLGAATSTGWMILLDARGASVDRLYYGTDTRIAEILTGAALAAALHGRTRWDDVHRRQLAAWLGVVALGVLLALYATVSYGDPWVFRGGLQVVACLGVVVVIGALQDDGPLARMLGATPLRSLGLVSYGVYLFHWPIFLWLQSEGWSPLAVFTLGGTLTLALAVASYRLLEQPVRHGRTVVGSARIALPLLVVPLLLVATVALTTDPRDSDPLALLAEAEADGITAAPTTFAPQVPGVDRPLRLLVVGDAATAELVPALAAADPDHVEVHAVTDAPCGDRMVPVGTHPPGGEPAPAGTVTDATPGTVATSTGTRATAEHPASTCVGWVDAWSVALDEVDPDVVLVMPGHWSASELFDAGGRAAPTIDDPSASTWVRRHLDAAVDLLSTGGATVTIAPYPHLRDVAGRPRVPAPELLVHDALAAVAATHPSARSLGSGDELTTVDDPDWIATTAAALTPRILDAGATPEPALPRIMVVGDSVSWFVGHGLDAWAARSQRAQVWNTGTLGCGIARGGQLLLSEGPTPSDPVCDAWRDRWRAQLDDFDPDIVVVLSGLWELLDRRRPGWDQFDHIGSARFDAYLLAEYAEAVDVLASDGARVVWLVPPCYADVTFPGPVSQTGALDPTRREHLVTDILPALAAGHPQLELVDLAGFVCPNGTFTQSFAGLDTTRPDGVHFSDAATVAIAEWLGPQLVP
jgi:peptidoglycan/LPS O-acetylase OafA/YrhL